MTQRSLITKACTAGGSDLGVSLNDAVCRYLLATIIHDLELEVTFPDVDQDFPPFFGASNLSDRQIAAGNFLELFERLIAARHDVDTYFFCLATLHKARLKYERILQSQAIPTIDQVGPRGLLQYGSLSPTSLVGLLFWRK